MPQIIAANTAVASDPNPDPGVRSDVIYEIQRRLVPYLSYMRRALLLPSLDAGQRATLSELLDRSERKCAEFEASLRQAWVDSGLIMHGAPPKPGLTLKEQNDVIAGIVAARKKANREWYLVAEGVLSLEQREALKRQTQPDARPESTSLR